RRLAPLPGLVPRPGRLALRFGFQPDQRLRDPVRPLTAARRGWVGAEFAPRAGSALTRAARRARRRAAARRPRAATTTRTSGARRCRDRRARCRRAARPTA